VPVHGHGQCAACGTNVEPCCGGAGDEADEWSGREIEVDPTVFPRVFDHLGGRDVAVTEDALVHAFCLRQGSTWDDARAVLGVAQRLGLLRETAAGVYRLGQRSRS
jgi:hypothetical protein